MPQINDIRELAQQNARYVSNSPQDWMSYLDVAAHQNNLTAMAEEIVLKELVYN